MQFPYAPPGLPATCQGRDACLSLIRTFFSAFESFEWRDVEVHAAQDPELVFATARSEAMLHSGQRCENVYCLVMRVRAGELIEYREYFNPLSAIELLKSMTQPA